MLCNFDDKVFWKCTLWEEEVEHNKHIVGGNKRLEFLDDYSEEEVGLITKVKEKLDSVWPKSKGNIVISSVTFAGGWPGKDYFLRTLTEYLGKRN